MLTLRYSDLNQFRWTRNCGASAFSSGCWKDQAKKILIFVLVLLSVCKFHRYSLIIHGNNNTIVLFYDGCSTPYQQMRGNDISTQGDLIIGHSIRNANSSACASHLGWLKAGANYSSAAFCCCLHHKIQLKVISKHPVRPVTPHLCQHFFQYFPLNSSSIVWIDNSPVILSCLAIWR